MMCSTESWEADRLPARSSKVTALPYIADRLQLFLSMVLSRTAATKIHPKKKKETSSALLRYTRTVLSPPRLTITDSHFCLPVFFFFRLKKQQHLQINQTLIGLRVVFFSSFYSMTPTCSIRHKAFQSGDKSNLFSQTNLLVRELEILSQTNDRHMTHLLNKT